MEDIVFWVNGWRLGLITVFCSLLGYLHLQRRRQQEADKIYGQKHGCQPVQKRLPSRWPLGIDILKDQYDALRRGHLLAYQADSLEKYSIGETCEVRLLGQIGYLTMDPKNVECMLQTHFDSWVIKDSRDGILPMIGHGIFTQDGPAWKHSREVLRRQFVRMQYQDMTIFQEPVQDLLSKLRAASSGDIVDLQTAFFRFTLATTVSLIFGEPFIGLSQHEQDEFAQAFDYTSLVSAMRIRLADWCWVYNPPRYKKACAVLKRVATRYVEYAAKDLRENGDEAASKRHPFIIDLFRELQDTNLVRGQLLNVLIAGRDTTALLMSWACFQLVRNPDCLQRLRREIASHTADGEPLTRAHINKMTYLRSVLNETNRLYTQLPVNIRIAKETTYLPRGGGTDGQSPLLIPKGRGVAFSTYHMHRSKEIYGEDANEFRPERWESGELRNIGFGFMPFHGGPRLCLGKDFALTEASYGLVHVLQEFPNLRIAPGITKVTPGREKQNLTLLVGSAEGVKVLLK